jgi:hypothetical protein
LKDKKQEVIGQRLAVGLTLRYGKVCTICPTCGQSVKPE